MVGVVRTEELNTQYLEAGAVVVLLSGEDLDIVTIQHIDLSGDWVVMGPEKEVTLSLQDKLCKLMILTDSGVYPLKFNQWKNAIKNKEVNSFKEVNFELIPAKFNGGKLTKICNNCLALFLGARTQGDCKKCCEENIIAQIKIKKKVKPKRPRMLTQAEHRERCETVARAAHKLAGRNSVQFEEWLNKQF